MIGHQKLTPEETSLPYRVIIDFLEGTLRKKDAIAFARGFIDHHFDAPNASGYYVAPYENGYIFEVHEGGPQRAYLPGILEALARDPGASVCVQMARRVIEVKRSPSGIYTAILLPEGMEPQSEDKVFPNAGPPLIPYHRSGLTLLLTSAIVFGVGFITLLLATLFFLVEVSGLLSPALKSIDFNALPLSQWPTLESAAGETSPSYIKTLTYENGIWQSEKAERKPLIPDPVVAPAPAPASIAVPDTSVALPGSTPVTSPAAPTATVPPGTSALISGPAPAGLPPASSSPVPQTQPAPVPQAPPSSTPGTSLLPPPGAPVSSPK